ncbi:MAG: M1 family metallopeptidase [Maricaulaceae bacterium]|jgi:alanyl aminopeptidase
MRLLLVALAGAVSVAACANTSGGPPVGRLGEAAEPLGYAVDLVVDRNAERFSGEAVIDVRLNAPTTTLYIHGDQLDVSEARFIAADGAETEAGYRQVLGSGVAELTFAEEVPAGRGELHFAYTAPFNTNAAGLYTMQSGGETYLVTQFEVLDARKVFPGFDEPRFKTPFRFTVTTPESDAVIFNTPETAAEPAGEGMTRHVFAETRPLPTYLIAMAIGPYDVVEWDDIPTTDIRDRPVPLRGVAVAGAGGGFGYSLENTAPLLIELESYFGEPYPFEKLDLIAVPEFAFGAMENAGAIVYRDVRLLFGDEAPASQRRSYAGTHSHEMAHMWFGDLVSPAWWTDIWLNEAFATWMAAKTVDAWQPDGEYDRNIQRGAIGAMNVDSLASTRQIQEPVTRNEGVWDAFDSITYQKGGGVISMIESYVGEEAFRDGVRAYIRQYADQSATSDQFFEAIGEGSGRPEVVSAFRSFVNQPGLPLVTAELSCDADGAQLSVAQSSYRPIGSTIPEGRRWEIPLCVAYDAGDERASACTLLADRAATIALETSDCPSSVVPNAGGAGYYRFTFEGDGWERLIADIPELPAGEALAAADSLEAAFRAGQIDAETYLDGVEALAQSPYWDAASAPAGWLTVLADAEATPGRDALRAFISRTYRPLWEDARAGDALADELLAEALTAALAGGAHDAEVIAALAEEGRAFIEAGSHLGAPGGPPSYALPNALAAGVSVYGPDFYDQVWETAATADDPYVRLSALQALAASGDADAAAWLREEGLGGEVITGREFRDILAQQMGAFETRDAAWTWVRDNFAAVLTRVPSRAGAQSPLWTAGFDTRARAEEVEAFFTANADLIPGYERSLAQALERIELNAALIERQGAALAAALADRM